MSARHEEGCKLKKRSSSVSSCAKVYLTMTSGWQGAPCFRRYGRILVSKPAISLKKSWGGYRRTTHEVGAAGRFLLTSFWGPRIATKDTRQKWAQCYEASSSLSLQQQAVQVVAILWRHYVQTGTIEEVGTIPHMYCHTLLVVPPCVPNPIPQARKRAVGTSQPVHFIEKEPLLVQVSHHGCLRKCCYVPCVV